MGDVVRSDQIKFSRLLDTGRSVVMKKVALNATASKKRHDVFDLSLYCLHTRPRPMLSRSLDLGAKSRTSRPEQRFPVGFSTCVSRYLTYGGLGAAGSAAEA